MTDSLKREHHLMQQLTQQDIAARAYQLWEEEGRPHGRDLDHWSKAASELSANGNGSNGNGNGAVAIEAENGDAAKPAKKASARAKTIADPSAPAAPKAKKPAKSKK
jgi:hypothetical protein